MDGSFPIYKIKGEGGGGVEEDENSEVRYRVVITCSFSFLIKLSDARSRNGSREKPTGQRCILMDLT